MLGWSVLTVAAILGSSQKTAGARDWIVGDPAVRFVEGTTSPRIDPLGRWSGRVAISVRCTIEADGSLDACAVIEESEPRRLSHRSARSGVQAMRLQLGEGGPRPGDTLTVEAVVSRP